MAPSYIPVSTHDDSADQASPMETLTAHMATTTLKVEGMTCGACTSAIESGFQGTPGIESCTVSLLSERCVVLHDPEIYTAQQIADIIEDRGFGAEVLDSQRTEPSTAAGGVAEKQTALATTTLAIEGMTCGACTSAVEGGFQHLNGMVRFNISLLAERAVIVHDPLALPAQKIAQIIEDRGFDARVLTSVLDGGRCTSKSSSIQLKIYGLTDAASSTSLENILRALPGVSSATIDLGNSRATIVHEGSLTGLRALVSAVEEAGFNALIADTDDNNAQLESLAKTREIQEWRRAFRTSLAFAIPVFLISMIFPMFLPFLDYGSSSLGLPGLYLGDVVCLVLTVPVQFGIGRRFYLSAFKSLRHGSPTMDVLVVLGTSAAFFFSVAAMCVSILSAKHSRPATVFDTSTMLITFITLGRYLENRAKGQTSKALSRLMSLAPSMATIYTDPIAAEKANEEWETHVEKTREGAKEGTASAVAESIIPTELIQVGDIVILRPGDKIPADGTVTRGESFVDESMVTGEAMPILKRPGAFLVAGTVNGTGRADFRVTRAGRDTQLSQIVKLVQEAQTSRAPIQRMADLVAGYFVPSVISLGVITFIGWMVLSHVLSHPPAIFTDEASGGRIMVCLKLCISVIVFACPCALGLSTPTAVMVGTGVGAENGMLVKGGAALETATRITHVVLDKTGTLTMGQMSVAEVQIDPVWESNDWRRRLWWTLVGLAESGSEHPIGRAALARAKEELDLSAESTLHGTVGDFDAVVGRGISALVEPANSAGKQRYRVLVGNAPYLSDRGVDLAPPSTRTTNPDSSSTATSTKTTPSRTLPAPPAGTTTIYIAIDGHYTGRLSLSDTLKPTAPALIAALHRLNITTSLITGDALPPALSVAQACGIPSSDVHASCSPSAKQSYIQRLQARGETVAMVGDGINDSPALATANVGIAMSSGTDVAMEAADIVLMRPLDLLDIPASLHLARTIFRRIKLNLWWACGYNVIGLPFAMGWFLPWGLHLHPMAAGAAMAASSVSVVGSSLLLKFWSRPAWMTVQALDGASDGSPLRQPRRRQPWPSRVVAHVRSTLRLGRGQDHGAYVPLDNMEHV